ncbi:MAG TPA: J domain-containing protein [Candidatus Nanopelagicales bacterium]|nr:J domain-containing protein [Candidatus Nanopelagicales bacterium]
MERAEAGRVLGVDPAASARAVERAFRRRTRDTHPDRFPPGSEAWEDASDRMRALVEARAVLVAPVPEAPKWRRTAEDGGTWAWSHEAPGTRSPSGMPYGADDPFPAPRDVDRRVRAWGLGWGGFLVLAALVSYLVGATQPTNDALPFWSPALFVTGCVAIAIGLRAHARLTRA